MLDDTGSKDELNIYVMYACAILMRVKAQLL